MNLRQPTHPWREESARLRRRLLGVIARLQRTPAAVESALDEAQEALRESDRMRREMRRVRA